MTIREIKSRKHKEYEQNRKDIYYRYLHQTD